MKIKAKQTRIAYTKEEKYQFFVEGKVRVPEVRTDKKKFNKAQRRKNKVRDFESVKTLSLPFFVSKKNLIVGKKYMDYIFL